MRIALRLPFLFAFGALVLVACAQPDATATRTSNPTPTPTPTPISPYEELLGLVPDTPETRSCVLINDYALIRELGFDIPLPGQGANESDMEEYYSYAPSPRGKGIPDLAALAACPSNAGQ